MLKYKYKIVINNSYKILWCINYVWKLLLCVFLSCHRKNMDVGHGYCASSQSVATVTPRKQHLDPADEHHLSQLCPIRHQGAIKKKYSDPAQVKLTAFKLLCEIF